MGRRRSEIPDFVSKKKHTRTFKNNPPTWKLGLSRDPVPSRCVCDISRPRSCTGPWTPGSRAELATRCSHLRGPQAAGHPHRRPRVSEKTPPSKAIRDHPARRLEAAGSSGPGGLTLTPALQAHPGVPASPTPEQRGACPPAIQEDSDSLEVPTS